MGSDIAGIGYVAIPPSGSGMGLIVLQEWWGLVPYIKSVADRFAEAGFVALAPDLFDGKQTTAPDEAERLLMDLNIEQTAAKLQTAIDFLVNHEAVTHPKLGIIGFCMGGQLALLAATLNPEIGATVDFYGIHPNVKPDFSQLSSPVLGIFGEIDGFVPTDAVAALETAIQQAGGSIESHTYPNADHAFFNDTRPEVYDPNAAADAWNRTLKFLQTNLSG